MSMLLFIIGGIAVMVGAATVAFGIPINEFSFGNTLIVSGSTVGTGGLIIIAIAAAVARLNRIAEALAAAGGALSRTRRWRRRRGAGGRRRAACRSRPGRAPVPSRRTMEPRGAEPPRPLAQSGSAARPEEVLRAVIAQSGPAPAAEEFPPPTARRGSRRPPTAA